MTVGQDALIRLYRRHARGLLTHFQRRVGDPELATDLMADTFTLALEKRAQFRGESDDELSGWLWRIAQSVLRDHERHREVARRGESRLGLERRALSDGEIERIEEMADSERLNAAIARCLDRLPANQREAVRMHVVDGLSYEEISQRLEISAARARSCVTGAMHDLRGMLESESLWGEGPAR